MNILVIGGYDTKNLGDYASFLGLQNILGDSYNFTVLSRHVDDSFSQEFNVSCIKNLDHETKNKSIGRMFNGFNSGDDNQHLINIYNEMIRSDAVLFGNGRLFVDISLDFMTGPLSYFSIIVILAKFMNKPIILYSVSLVHPKTENGKKHLKMILDNSNAVIVREISSAETASKYMSDSRKISILPDIAFSLPVIGSQESIDFLLPDEFIVVNFRGLDFTSELSIKKIKDNANKVISLIERYQTKVIFISQCNYNVDNDLTDDRETNRKVYIEMPSKYQSQCLLVEDELSLKETLTIYKNATHTFTYRRHGFILALTQQTTASLICNEDNTKFVKDSISDPRFYLDDKSEFIIPTIDRVELARELTVMKVKCNQYKSIIENICNKS
ncbi:polysaccharide pyruvyl transferase family protein [Shewanella sp. AC34-MNA-CIBAN-0136]|uniref:polysaccharide pyruvyl transferase family protein n=1 Tax=Shewanella sp. AC34-MNA-CIBAN-0136 TaxID=3140463 RepID=UPI00331B84EE